MDQVAVCVLGICAVWLTQDSRALWRRWACIFGLLSQPFWFYATWNAHQYGMFALSIIYTIVWARGLKTYWISRE